MSESSDAISEAVAANLAGPKRVTSGTTTVEQHDPLALAQAEQLKANADAATAGANTKRLGIRMRKLIPPGAY